MEEEIPPLSIRILRETSSSVLIEISNNSESNFMFQWMLDLPDYFKIHPSCGRIKSQETKHVLIDRLSGEKASAELAILFKQREKESEDAECWHCTLFEDNIRVNMIPLKIRFHFNLKAEVCQFISPCIAGSFFVFIVFLFLLKWSCQQERSPSREVFDYSYFREV